MTLDIDDTLWAAIGDPTRLRVIDLLLTGGPASASSLSRQLPVTRQAVAKHIGVLEAAGMVVRAEPSGREVRYAVQPDQFDRALAQFTAVSQAWDRRLHRIKAIAEDLSQTARAQHPTTP